ncbi:MAG: hypothetical protein PHW87_07975, partial [Methanothrix sp.]|nr:hypothetical protein [Methanothrix sp.]
IVKRTNIVIAPKAPGPYIPDRSGVIWTYEVTNTGNVELKNVTVTDDKLPDYSDTIDSLAPQATHIFTAPASQALAGQYINNGTATGTPPAGIDVSARNISHYFGSLPEIKLNKEADRLNAKVGDKIVYNLTIRNLGTNDIRITDLKDTYISSFTPNPIGKTLTPKGTSNDTLIVTGTYTITESDLPGPIVNEATIEGKDSQGNEVNSTDNATVNLADLEVTKTADPIAAPKGAIITYNITAYNQGSTALNMSGVDVLDPGLEYISDDFNGTEDPKNTITWPYLFWLDPGSSRTFSLKAMIDGSVNGSLWNDVTLTGKAGNEVVTGNARAEVTTQTASINVTKVAFPPDGVPGTEINYTIVITNTGEADLWKVALVDMLPDGMMYLWDDYNGTFTEPNRVDWFDLGRLNSGEKITISMDAEIVGTVMGELDNVVGVTAVPVSGGDPVESISEALINAKPVPFVISKTSDKKVYRPGEEITYTITVCNLMEFLPLEDVVVKDVFQNSIEIVASYPEPSEDGMWYYDSIPPEGCIKIIIVARTPEDKSTFDLEQSVDGVGFVNVHNDLSTSVGPYSIDNCVYVTAKVWPEEWERSTCHSVTVQDKGTELETREHGSGDYSSEEIDSLKWENKSLESIKNVSASYYPTTFDLPGNNGLNYSSKWTEESRAKNWLTGTVMHETYRYATDIDRNSYVKMDENGSKMMVDADFTGKGSIGFVKKSSPDAGPKSKPIFESQEDYSGQFRINESFEEYGKNVVTYKAASGEGFVAADKRIRSSQRTYESGTGSYKSEEIVDSFSNYMAKDIEVAHKPSSYNYSPTVQAKQNMKWNEGMWSKSGILRGGDIIAANDSSGGTPVKECIVADNGTAPATVLSERYSSVEYLKKDSIALGLNEMKTNATFQGVADYRAKAVSSNGTDRVDNEERYAGDFSLRRHVLMTGVAKYDYPHITVTKEGLMKSAMFNGTNSTVADYVITITNDGNRALAPVYVWDHFPPGTQYINSSYKPSALSATEANWTILHLGIGNSLTINLRLNITENAPGNVLNCVVASGITGDTLVSSTNCFSLDSDWLGCCPPKVSVEKKARLDSSDPTMVHYIIVLRNNANRSVAAEVIDEIPGEMSLTQSSVVPYSVDSNYIRWNFADLASGELVTIEYDMRAARNGAYTNRVHVDASALDGSGSNSADASSYIDVRETGVAPKTMRYNGWQPPDWDLNTSEEGIAI